MNRTQKGFFTHEINARYYMQGAAQSYDVADRARELQFEPAIVFSNGTEQECRDWVLRNCEEPAEHSEAPWVVNWNPNVAASGAISISSPKHTWSIAHALPCSERDANAALIGAAPKLLALLEQYHQSFPSKESGKLICEAKGWTIQE